MSNMQYTFCRGGNGSYLVFREDVLFDGYERKMLQQSTIPLLLEEHIVRLGKSCELHYRISGMQTLEKRFEKKKMKTADVSGLLDGIVRVRSVCTAHLLPDTHLFLAPDLIYVSYLQADYRFLYLPEEETVFAEQIRLLADFLMKHISYDSADDAGVEIVYALQEVVGRDGFELKDWWEQMKPAQVRDTVLSERDAVSAESGGEAGAAVWQGSSVPSNDRHIASGAAEVLSGSLEVVNLDDWDMKWQEDLYADMDAAGSTFSFLKKRKRRKEKKEGGRDKGTYADEKRKKVSIEEDREKGKGSRRKKDRKKRRRHTAAKRDIKHGTEKQPAQEQTAAEDLFAQAVSWAKADDVGTVCLSDPGLQPIQSVRRERQHALIPTDGGQEILLNHSLSLIGSSPRNADIVLQDPTVSRIHAEIFEDGEDVFIEDCNSSNGTVADGKMLGPNERKKLESGMHLRFGRSEFVFR